MTEYPNIPTPKVKASLATIEISDGGVGGVVVGDLFDVTSTYGKNALVTASSIRSLDYNMSFNLVNSYNFGYTATADASGVAIVNSLTKIIISDLVLGVANSGLVDGDILYDSTGAVIGTVMESNDIQVWLTGTAGPTAWAGLEGQVVTGAGKTFNVSLVYNGSGAKFEILETDLMDTQTIISGTDIIGSSNLLSTPYLTILLNSADYGFPKAVVAAEVIGTRLIDALGFTSQTLGRVFQLSRIVQGSNYNTSIKVKVINPFIMGTSIQDIILVANNTSGVKVGDVVSQYTGAKGLITKISGNQLTIMPMSYGLALLASNSFIVNGVDTNTFTTSLITSVSTSRVMGNNLDISGSAQWVSGKVGEVFVVSSGMGYKEGEVVKLTSRTTGQVLTGVAHLAGTGKSEGRWLTTTSHLNWNTYIRDNDYYQEYSYEIQSPRSLTDYEDVVKNITHPAGTKLFGKVVKETVFNESYGFAACLSTDLSADFVCADTIEIF